jgi:hypothetical protein
MPQLLDEQKSKLEPLWKTVRKNLLGVFPFDGNCLSRLKRQALLPARCLTSTDLIQVLALRARDMLLDQEVLQPQKDNHSGPHYSTAEIMLWLAAPTSQSARESTAKSPTSR